MASKLPDQIAEDLRFVTGRLRRRLRTELAGEGLPPASETMLRRIEQLGPCTTAALARAELITPQAAGTLIARLEAQGYVTRRADASDGRRQLLALTPAAHAPLAAQRARRQGVLAGAIAERFEAEELRTIATALRLLRTLVEPAS